MAWYHDAPCKGQTDLFYSEHPEKVAQAKEVCAACPWENNECLVDALEARRPLSDYGVQAGMTPSERKAYAERLVALPNLSHSNGTVS